MVEVKKAVLQGPERDIAIEYIVLDREIYFTTRGKIPQSQTATAKVISLIAEVANVRWQEFVFYEFILDGLYNNLLDDEFCVDRLKVEASGDKLVVKNFRELAASESFRRKRPRTRYQLAEGRIPSDVISALIPGQPPTTEY